MKNLMIIVAIAFLFLLVNKNYSQDLKSLEKTNDKAVIGLTFTHPSFSGSNDMEVTSGIYEIYGDIKIGDKLRLIGNIPYSTYSENKKSLSTLGNISLGLKYLFGKNQNMTFSGFIYLPTAGDDDYIANYLSANANFWEFHKFLNDYTTINVNFNFKETKPNGFFYGAGIGNQLYIRTENNHGDHDVDDYIDYFAVAGYEKENSIGCELQFAGMYFASSEFKKESDKFVHLFKFALSYQGEIVKPKLFVVLPVGDRYSKLIDNLIGIEFQFYLK